MSFSSLADYVGKKIIFKDRDSDKYIVANVVTWKWSFVYLQYENMEDFHELFNKYFDVICILGSRDLPAQGPHCANNCLIKGDPWDCHIIEETCVNCGHEFKITDVEENDYPSGYYKCPGCGKNAWEKSEPQQAKLDIFG